LYHSRVKFVNGLTLRKWRRLGFSLSTPSKHF
jgi:hypothetical protein